MKIFELPLGCYLSLFLGLSGSTALIHNASAANPLPIPLPCLDPKDMGKPRLDLQACDIVEPNLISGLVNYSKNRIRCLYYGYILDDNGDINIGTDAATDCRVKGTPVGSGRNVCSLNDNEDNTNILEKSCGISGKDSDQGRWESSQLDGLWVQAVKYYTMELIEKEIKKGRQLIAHDGCKAMSEDYVKYTDSFKRRSESLTATLNPTEFPSEIFRGGVNFCTQKDEVKTADTKDLLKNIPQTTACYLAASAVERGFLFSQIARCEIWNRISNFYSTIATQQTQKLAGIINDCLKQAYQKGKDVGYSKLSRSAGEEEGRKEFGKCYDPKVRQYFRDIVNQNIPGHFDWSIK